MSDLKHFVRLNRGARIDIEWSFSFESFWNGVSMLYQTGHLRCTASISTDASGNWGCGAFCGRKWFYLRWPLSLWRSHITVKELVPIVPAATGLGSEWVGQNVMAYCDNAAMVAVLWSAHSKEPKVMHLMRCLAFLKAKSSSRCSPRIYVGKRTTWWTCC